MLRYAALTALPNGKYNPPPVRHAADQDGNLTGDGVWSYGYDSYNRLESANKPGLAATLAYDGEGRLRQTTIAGVTTNLLYDGQDLIAEYDGSGNLLRRYVHGPGVDEPLVWYEGTGTANKTWLYGDHLGSLVATANGSGASTALYSYGPYGEPNVTTGVRFRYTGQQFLGQLNLYHYKARMYSPALGRFLQTDPIGYGDDLNLYAYVGNDPVNLTDPSGNCPSCIGAVSSVVMGAIIRGMTGGEILDWGAIALDAGLGAVGTGLTSKAINLISLARAGTTNIERSIARGALGESMAGISSTGKRAIDIGNRIPDRLTATTLEEVKNVARLSTRDAAQIGDEAAYAARGGLDMTLWTRKGADLSRIQGLIDNGALSVRTIPGVGSNGFRILTNGESAALGFGIGGTINGSLANAAGK